MSISTSPQVEAHLRKGIDRRAWAYRLGMGLVSVAAVVGIFTIDQREYVGVSTIVLMLALIFSKVPVGIALSFPGMLGLYSLYGSPALVGMLRRLPFDTVASWEYSVIPMFVFMGLLLWHSGITESVYALAQKALRWLPGGLGIGTNVAAAGLAATSGSTIGILYAVGRIAMPEMLRAGYDRRLASGAILMAGLIGQIIPPSIFLVIYAGIAQVPVGQQLIAGIGPGLLMMACFAGTIFVVALIKPSATGRDREEEEAAGELKDRSCIPTPSPWEAAPLVFLIALVVGGLYIGLFTATEAGAAGALGALIILIGRKRSPKVIYKEVSTSAVEAVSASGGIFFLLIGSLVLARVLAVSGLGVAFADWVTDANVSRFGFLMIIVVVYLILGMFMDSLSILILTIPLLMPLVIGLEISPLWFGVFTVILAEMAMVTPPVGVLAFIFHDLVKNPEVNRGTKVTLGNIFAGVGLFIPAVVLICVLLIAFPEIATYLTDRM